MTSSETEGFDLVGYLNEHNWIKLIVMLYMCENDVLIFNYQIKIYCYFIIILMSDADKGDLSLKNKPTRIPTFKNSTLNNPSRQANSVSR